MTVRGHVQARLLRLWRDLRSMATLRRREKRLSTYLLRLLCLALLAALPIKKLIQLGALGFLLATVKAAVAVALVVGVLATAFAIEAVLRRRRRLS
ncbi:hypothetical protein [Rubrimonas cliftonensis]|uniref:Uncharacterized protein n=1 Tax=Rubrimonas cliftonensis TaxID=89524 RepID=A0A1H4BBZ3_9RHOB|nr:hypothetical protein [Rubrimonas cliftonensis]SEA45703.1 hypothetical protein SAMN05444370_105128 [Rubrimonas cliftonensis]